MENFLLQLLFIVICGIILPLVVIAGCILSLMILEKIEAYKENKIIRSVDYVLLKVMVKSLVERTEQIDFEQIEKTSKEVLSSSYNYNNKKEFVRNTLNKSIEFYKKE